MITFDFEQYFKKLQNAPDSLAKSYIKRDWFLYYDGLSKEEQQVFKREYQVYLDAKNQEFNVEIGRIKTLMMQEGIQTD